MSTEAALKALSNNQLQDSSEIQASQHRTVNDAIIEEMFDGQSRGDVLSGVQVAGSLVAGDYVLVIRSGVAYLLDASTFGFIDTLVGLSDVNISSPLNDQILAYDSASSKYVLKNLSDITTGSAITGSGTINAIPVFTASGNIGDSNITDDGTTINLGLPINVNNNSGISISGVQTIFKDSDYTFFKNPEGNICLYLGDSANPNNYHNNGGHVFRSVNGSTVYANLDSTGLTLETGKVQGYKDTSLGTNATALDAESARELNVTAATYTASTTLTFSNVTNLRRFTMQLTNTNANVLTFSGVTLYFKSDDLPSGVSFGSNALTFPADSAVKYNLVAEKFDGSTFDCKIEIR